MYSRLTFVYFVLQLEEFRRKKAAEKAKKTTSSSQLHVSDAINEKQPEHENVRITDSNGVGTSDAPTVDRFEPSANLPKIATTESDTSRESDFSFSTATNDKPSLSARNNEIDAPVLQHSYLYTEENKDIAAAGGLDGFKNSKDKPQSNKDNYSGSSVEVAFEVGKYPPSNVDGLAKDLSPVNSGMFVSNTNDLPKPSVSTLLKEKLGSSGNEDNNLSLSPYPGKSLAFLPEYVPTYVFSFPQNNINSGPSSKIIDILPTRFFMLIQKNHQFGT